MQGPTEQYSRREIHSWEELLGTVGCFLRHPITHLRNKFLLTTYLPTSLHEVTTSFLFRFTSFRTLQLDSGWIEHKWRRRV
jgi:hypothetical protein